MFMQVFIERVRRIAHRGGYIQLILCGGAISLIRIYGWVDGTNEHCRGGIRSLKCSMMCKAAGSKGSRKELRPKRTVTRSYIRKLLDNPEIKKFLNVQYVDILQEFTALV